MTGADQMPGPIVGYRWFQVRDDGQLGGAQNVPWATGSPLHARHVSAPLLLRLLAAPLVLVAVVLVVFDVVLLVVLAAGGPVSPPVTSAAVGEDLGTTLMAVGLAAIVASYAPPWPRFRHVCPARPRRLFRRWVPECGIYAFNDLGRATLAASSGDLRFLSRPVVVARVTLWGRVFPYSEGYRAEWARLETIFDDGSGQVEIPAARYGVPLESFPDGVTPPVPARAARRLRGRQSRTGRLSDHNRRHR